MRNSIIEGKSVAFFSTFCLSRSWLPALTIQRCVKPQSLVESSANKSSRLCNAFFPLTKPLIHLRTESRKPLESSISLCTLRPKSTQLLLPQPRILPVWTLYYVGSWTSSLQSRNPVNASHHGLFYVASLSACRLLLWPSPLPLPAL